MVIALGSLFFIGLVYVNLATLVCMKSAGMNGGNKSGLSPLYFSQDQGQVRATKDFWIKYVSREYNLFEKYYIKIL